MGKIGDALIFQAGGKAMSYGYWGKILHVNLSDQKTYIEEPNEEFYRTYVGGSCMGAYYVYKNVRKNTDALSPENVIVFSTSPTTGAPISGSSRFNLTAKSPLTGTLGDSQGGGFWGTELKFAGYDAIVITGKAKKPVYLWINNDKVEIRDASHLWGKTTGEAQRMLVEELGDKRVRIAQIGLGGENLVRYAGVTSDLKHFNGRNGMGAVLGSKNLKAIAVRGTKSINFYDADAIKKLAKYGSAEIKQNPSTQGLQKYGTSMVIDANNDMGGLPTRNWTSGVFDNVSGISCIRLNEDLLKKNESCWACSVRCKRVVEAEEPYIIDPIYGGPEYESIASLGSYLCIDDIGAVAKANELCNKYTIDTISLGGTVAFAMECFEKGIIGLDDTDGIDLSFGNSEALLKIIEKIAYRDGIGNVLAEGSARAAKVFGRGSEQYAMHVKGQELPAHMPRVKASLALAYACGPFGADHQSSEHDTIMVNEPLGKPIRSLGVTNIRGLNVLDFEKVKLWTYSQRAYSLLDTLDLCQFCFGFWTIYNMDHAVELVNAATGWSTNLWELMLVGERRVNLMKSFNWREGFNQEDDVLPQRIHTPLKGGLTENQMIDPDEFLKARREYYELAGWEPDTGKPTVHKLRELGLDWVVDTIY